MTSFIGIDGEADAQGRYIVLCDSQGRVLYNPEGITSSEAFAFLLALPRGYEIMCYGLNYDVNQWLKDLSRPSLERLASANRCTWRGEYKLQWIPSKMFTVTVPNQSVTVCEAFGFFQTSFVKALEQWGFTPPSELTLMKARRGSFTGGELQRVVAYCQDECRLLTELMARLQDACAQADCAPRRRWIGAGSIASSLLTKYDTKQVHAHDADLFGRELTDEYVLRAYFGGRVELYLQGWADNVVAYDIRSAYPSAVLHLPSLADATLYKTARYDPMEPYALWLVTWDATPYKGAVSPFPVRLPSGSICYPLQGSGVYHASEVRAAMDVGFPVEVCSGVVLRPATVDRPFTWINDVYKHREQFKQDGNFAEKALKLGLNSVYGKFAQGYGYGRRPPFQSYFYAGYITALTRARLLRMLRCSPSPVMAATDGAVGTFAASSQGTGIGSWEATRYDRVATIQPGVYVAEKNGERFVKSRGFFARDVDYNEMLEQFHADPLSCHHFRSRRFIGLKVALHRKDFSVWRQWVDERRSVAFEINNKRRTEVEGGRVLLHPCLGPYESLPYVPKQSLYDDPSDDTLENLVRDDQPHREVD